MFVSQKMAPFAEAVQKCFTDLATRSDLVMHTVAWTIAKDLPLPSAPVADTTLHFNNTSGLGVMELIGQINEVVVFDVREARELVRSYWMVRYHTLFPSVAPGHIPVFDFFCGASQVGRYFTREQHAFLAKHSTEIYRVSDCLSACFKED